MNLPPLGGKRRRYLNAAQVEALADAAGPGRAAVLVLSYCGLRWSELAALRVRNFDLLRRRVIVEEAVTEIDGSNRRLGDAEDAQPAVVPLPRFLVDELAREVVNRPGTSWRFRHPRAPCCETGTPAPAGSTRRHAPPVSPGLTPHELRHTAASLAVHAGANVKAVQRMLGHASAAMTLDRYADLFDDDLDDVADRLDRLRAAIVRTGCGIFAD